MSATVADGLPQPQRRWAVLAIALALIMAVLDSAIANIALPTIARDLQVTDAASIWVVNAYQLAVTMSLLPLASLGEIVGYRRVHIAGLVLFVVASLLCALSGSLLLLTLARVLQGLGAAGMMSVNVALIRFVFPRNKLGSGIGLNAMVGSVATAVGPTVASAILSVAHWPWLFAVNVPVGLFALMVAWRALPVTQPSAARFDVVSALLSAASFGLLISGVDGLAHGEAAVLVAAEVVGMLVIGTLLVRRQAGADVPAAAGGPAAGAAVRAVGGRVGVLLRGAGHGVCGHAVPVAEHAGLRPGADGAAAHPLAAERGVDRAGVGLARGPVFGGGAGRRRPGGDGGGAGADGDADRRTPRTWRSCGARRCAGWDSASSTHRTTAR